MAEVAWIGNALDIVQEDTITVATGGGWGGGDTITLTINGKALIITLTTATVATNTIIASTVFKAINATSATNNLENDESRNTGGQEIEELRKVTAETAVAVCTCKGNTAGVPYTITSVVTSGAGSITLASSVACTGSKFFDNADNWSDGAVPTGGSGNDSIVFDNRAVSDCLYALDQSANFAGATRLDSVVITSDFTKKIGLAEVNEDDASYPYSEYFQTYLKAEVVTMDIGEGAGLGSGRIKWDLSSGTACTLTVQKTGTPAESNIPSVIVKGTNASNVLVVYKGCDVGVAYFEGEASTLLTVVTEGNLTLGDSMTLTTVNVEGGTAFIQNSTTTLNVYGGTVKLDGGTHTAGTVYSESTLEFHNGTITTLTLSGSLVCNKSVSNSTRTITNELELYAGAKVVDPRQSLTLSAGFQTNHCKLSDVDLDFGLNRQYTLT